MACQIPFNLAASCGIQRPGGCLKMRGALQQNVERDVGIVDNAFHRYFSSIGLWTKINKSFLNQQVE